MEKYEWILCPSCGSKTRNQIRKDTVLENFPLYCPKCKQETLINASNLTVTVVKGETHTNCTDNSTRSTAFYVRTAEYYPVLDNAENEISLQIDKLKQYAADNNISDYKFYIDNGKSGMIADRLALQELVADCKENKIGAIIVTNLERIARSVKIISEITELCRDRNILMQSYKGDNFILSFDMCIK